jgi:hypothetical protein
LVHLKDIELYNYNQEMRGRIPLFFLFLANWAF